MRARSSADKRYSCPPRCRPIAATAGNFSSGLTYTSTHFPTASFRLSYTVLFKSSLRKGMLELRIADCGLRIADCGRVVGRGLCLRRHGTLCIPYALRFRVFVLFLLEGAEGTHGGPEEFVYVHVAALH